MFLHPQSRPRAPQTGRAAAATPGRKWDADSRQGIVFPGRGRTCYRHCSRGINMGAALPRRRAPSASSAARRAIRGRILYTLHLRFTSLVHPRELARPMRRAFCHVLEPRHISRLRHPEKGNVVARGFAHQERWSRGSSSPWKRGIGTHSL